jgi:hypothetical protein
MKSINDFTDKELADMVRNGCYLQGESFGDDANRFLLVLAVPYGSSDGTFTLSEAVESFRALLTDDDWEARNFQVYDHGDQRFFEISFESLNAAGDDSLEYDETDAQGENRQRWLKYIKGEN